MSQDANTIPLDDEDILDLTVVAEPAKQSSAPPHPTTADGPPEPGGLDDFGSDLDALLDNLAADGPSAPPQAPPETPVAAPIADQTPADHVVDPDEEISMPEMSDIDSLLAELGADVSAEQPTSPAPQAAPIAEFDGVLAQAQAADAQKAAAEATPDLDDILNMTPPPSAPAPQAAPIAEFNGILAQAQAADAQKAAAETTPDLDDILNMTPPPPAAPALAPAVQDPPEPEAPLPGEDSLDLNELDALLDDILATAPEAGSPAPAPTPPPAPVQTPPPAPQPALVIPVPDQAIMPAANVADLAEKIRKLEEKALSKGDIAAIEEKLQSVEASAAPQSELGAVAEKVQLLEEKAQALDDVAALAEKIRQLEEKSQTLDGVADLAEKIQQLEEKAQVIDGVGALAGRVLELEKNALPKTEAAAFTERIQNLEDSAVAGETINALAEKILNLEKALEESTANREEQPVETVVAALVDARIETALSPDSPTVQAIVAAVLQRLSAADGESEHSEAFRASLEKLVAAAAAKVIREEIAALMAE